MNNFYTFVIAILVILNFNRINANPSSFVGSCNFENQICFNFQEGYTKPAAQSICSAQSSGNFSELPCSNSSVESRCSVLKEGKGFEIVMYQGYLSNAGYESAQHNTCKVNQGTFTANGVR
ncbi:hypothetical protein [Leptospira santarosai]|uniref:hypothetical protein n=1 Tax=Leptospira santarosai TaxID=28183 RepID=UPI0002E56CD6|nr:hypothetical protein [Leptospira santarosai]